MYDIIIIGGGIAGLYVTYEFNKRDPSSKLLLLESSNRLGGKIKTKYSNSNDKKIKYETGPWRVNYTHHRLNNLIDKFKLTRLPIKLDLKTETNLGSKKSFKNKPGLSILDTKFVDSAEIIQAVKDNIATGYYDLFDMDSSTNAYDVKAINKIQNYFVIEEGLSEIVNRISESIPSKVISLQSAVLDVEYLSSERKYSITYQFRTGHNSYQIKKLTVKSYFSVYRLKIIPSGS